MKNIWIALGLCLSVVAAGCASEKAEIKEDRLTVGKVQGEIKVGMAASQVAELLGSPNIVTTDEKRREVWMYDKVSTDRVDTASSSFAGIIILGARAFDTTDRRRMFEAIISTMQDLDFNVELLDEELGIISGKKFIEAEESEGTDPTYLISP